MKEERKELGRGRMLSGFWPLVRLWDACPLLLSVTLGARCSLDEHHLFYGHAALHVGVSSTALFGPEGGHCFCKHVCFQQKTRLVTLATSASPKLVLPIDGRNPPIPFPLSFTNCLPAHGSRESRQPSLDFRQT